MSKKPVTTEEQSPLFVEIDKTGMRGYAVILIHVRDKPEAAAMVAGMCELELLESPRVAQAFNTLAEMLARTAHERMFPHLGPVNDFVHIHPDRKLDS